MKYGLPTDDGKTVGKVFGRAKSFAIYDDADSSLAIVANTGASAEHGAGTGSAAFLAGKKASESSSPRKWGRRQKRPSRREESASSTRMMASNCRKRFPG